VKKKTIKAKNVRGSALFHSAMEEASQVTRVCCIGAGYVGGPTSAVLAAKAPHVEVVVCDRDRERIAAWNSDTLPLFEPGLEHVVETAKAQGNLHFTTGWNLKIQLTPPDIRTAVQKAELIFIAVNTPSRGDSENCEGGGLMGTGYDLAAYEGVARSIAGMITKLCTHIRICDGVLYRCWLVTFAFGC
jgi:UDPglucose 6-dehydrogenase